MKYRICSLVTMMLILYATGTLYAGSVTVSYGVGSTASNVQAASGQTTAQTVTPVASNPTIINPDIFITSPPLGVPATEPGAPVQSGDKGVGVNAIWSRKVKVYTVPAAYAFTDNFKFGLNIPLLEKRLTGEYTGEELSARGLGDVSLEVKFRYGSEERIQGITSLGVKLPSGSYQQFEGRREILSLGTGSYDFMINQTASKIVGTFRIVANLGYRWNRESDYVETDNFGINKKFENQQGNIFTYLLGMDYQTPYTGLSVYGNLAGSFIGRSHAKETNVATNAITRDETKKDRIRTLDVVTGLKVQVTKKIGVRLGVIIPALTSYDPDATDPDKRDWAVDMGLAGLF